LILLVWLELKIDLASLPAFWPKAPWPQCIEFSLPRTFLQKTKITKMSLDQKVSHTSYVRSTRTMRIQENTLDGQEPILHQAFERQTLMRGDQTQGNSRHKS